MNLDKLKNFTSLYELLIKGLGHELRTPLSVVINDLEYLNAQYPSADCQRSLKRAREIAEYLSRLQLAEVEVEEFALKDILEVCPWAKIPKPVENMQEVYFKNSFSRFSQILCLFKDLLLDNFLESFAEIDMQTKDKELLLSFRSKINLDENQTQESESALLSDLWQLFTKRDEPRTVLFDVLSIDLALNSKFLLTQDLVWRISLPICERSEHV